MTLSYTWAVDRLDCHSETKGVANMVATVGVRVTGSDGTNAASVSTSVDVPLGKAPYTPFEALTEAQIVGWVRTALGTAGVTSIETEIAQKIGNAIVLESPKLPWAPVEEMTDDDL